MPTSYTSLLGLALPVTGELSGTWGDTVNDYITQYLDASVAGTQTISGSQTAVTLSKTTATSLSQAGSGATGSSQYMIINCTGNPASLLTITAPAASKPYIVINGTSTSQSVKIVGAGPTTGVTLVSGEKAVVAWNGSDFTKVASTVVTPAGSTTQVQYNNAGALAGSANLTFDGTTLTASASAASTGIFKATSTTAQVANLQAQNDAGTSLFMGVFGSAAGTSGTLGASSPFVSTNGTQLVFNVNNNSGNFVWGIGSTPAEQMRLTTTGLGIGTSSPAYKLSVNSGATTTIGLFTSTGSAAYLGLANSGATTYIGNDSTSGSFIIQTPSGGFSTKLTLDNPGNLGLGVTPSAWSSSVASQVGYGAALSSRSAGNTASDMTHGAYWNGTNWLYQYSSVGAARYQMTGANGGSTHAWFVSAGGTAGNAISFTQAMTLDANGNLGLGTTTPRNVSGYENLTIDGSTSGLLDINTNGTRVFSLYGAGNDINLVNPTATGTMQFYTNNTSKLTITAAGFTRPVAYADTVSALGNTGTATTINLQNANVFTATLTGNCTFTLSNPIATGSSSFTLILTNDGTAGRTVAWAGGAFRFPGGAASLSRTTTANATDIWVFFTPDGGTTWYGNIAMKNMAA